MTVAIRQEVNFINTSIVSDGADQDSDEHIEINSDDFNSPTGYFEIVATNSNVSDQTVQIRRDNDVGSSFSGNLITGAGVTIPANTTTKTRIRGNSFTLDSTNIYYRMWLNAVPSTDVVIYSAKIIVLQSATDITDTQTQIEIGAYQSKTSAAAANTWYPLDEPKYWEYESDKWDPTPTITFGVTYACESNKATINFGIQKDDGAGGWTTTPIAFIAGLTSEDADYQESSWFTPTNGKIHRLVWQTSNTMYGADVYNAKIILTQTGMIEVPPGGTPDNAELYGGSGTNEKLGQSFTVGAGADSLSLCSIDISLFRSSSPSDNIYLEIATGSFDGATIATSSSINSATISAIGSEFYSFEFPTKPILSSSTKYYIRILRDGSRDTDNYILVKYRTDSYLANGGKSVSNSGTWDSESSTEDFYLKVNYKVVKLQPEYLLVNEAQTDTGLQEFQTYFDPDEWDGVDNDYYHEHSADSGSSNTQLVELMDEQNYLAPLVTNNLSATYTGYAQSFTGNGKTIHAVNLYLKKFGSPTGNAVAVLYAHSGTFGSTSIPTGAALATSDSFDVSNLTTSYELVTFELSTPYETTSGTKYCVAVEYTAGDASNYVSVGSDNDASHHDGNMSRYSGSWLVLSTRDMFFKILVLINNSDITGDDLVRGYKALSYEVEDANHDLFGGTGSNEMLGMRIYPATAMTIYAIDILISKDNSPTDDLTLKIKSGSMDGTVIGTSSNTVDGANLTTTNHYHRFHFPDGIALSATTYYYLELSRSGARDTTNHYIWRYTAGSGDIYGYAYKKESGSWSGLGTSYNFVCKMIAAMTMPSTAKEIDAYIVTA